MSASSAKALDAPHRVVLVCDVLAGLITPDVDDFAADVRTQWAVEMGLMRIGESVNRMPPDVLDRFPEQPWRVIVAMRNSAAHPLGAEMTGGGLMATVADDLIACNKGRIEADESLDDEVRLPILAALEGELQLDDCLASGTTSRRAAATDDRRVSDPGRERSSARCE